MNRLRGKKKGKDEAAGPRPSVDTESSGPFKMFGKNKKSYDEPKTPVEIPAALPSNDDFRTSLLMTGLSARFSMLREQDDPTSKIGKASDDSVLFPKRQSRMDFGMGGLGDIAEVESIRTPPFARLDSLYSSDDSNSMTGGSIMNRAKPTEGNNLFGGRQKIYKISAAGASKGSGLSGRPLYDDDVAHSAFQRWRQAERERRSLEDNRANDSLDIDSHLDYNRRRETNSTTSSTPSAARNSTAATSVASSQPAPSLKDWQPPNPTPGSTAQGALLDRSVTRTRRLYEQGLTQDLQDHQSSALSRMDTLSKRSFGTRTPDQTPTFPSPNPSMQGAPDRRGLVGKASAPNLRSFSPPALGSSRTSPAENGSQFPSMEGQAGYGSTPPLSPPISETEDHPTLHIQPNDRGKATALGVFSRPAQQYDDSKYAQRQKQMQQGRDTPTNRYRAESNSSAPTSRSRSSSSMRRMPLDKSGSAAMKAGPTFLQDQSTFFDDAEDDTDFFPDHPARAAPHPQLSVERPDDEQHPAFRKSALPTPLSVGSRSPDEPVSSGGQRDYLSTLSGNEMKDDSPTLGPPSGLSGMVRQHLRNVSTASSVYGPGPDEDEVEPVDRVGQFQPLGSIDLDNNDWGLNENEWNMSFNHTSPPRPAATADRRQFALQSPPRTKQQQEEGQGQEQDDFARHLADGARRVREKLTSYAETDPNAAALPAAAYSESANDLAPPKNGMLRSKSSKSSLAERGRDSQGSRRVSEDDYAAAKTGASDKAEGPSAGLKAFRQARRELQRMKEQDLQQRRQGSRASPSQSDMGSPPFRSGAEEHDRSMSDASSNGQSLADSPPASRPGPRQPPPMRAPPMVPGLTRSPQVLPMGSAPAGPNRSGSTQSLNVNTSHHGYDGSLPSPIPSLNGSQSPNAGFGAASSSPNLNGATSAPPLPPINPRRKTTRTPSGEEDEVTSPRGRARPGRRSQRAASTFMPDEQMTPEQFRQRLRKVPSEANGVMNGNRVRTSPPRGNRPPPPKNTMSSSSMPGGVPGGVI